MAAWVKSRPFTSAYIVIISAVFLKLGFGSTTICETLAEQFICANAIWAVNLTADPIQFVFSFFTAPWFHNGFTHFILIFVCLLIICQTAEVRIGTRRTILMFFLGTLGVGTLISIILNVGFAHSDAYWFEDGMTRNWMGGSVGLYFVMGALFAQIKNPRTAVSIYLVLDMLNLFVLHGAGSHTVLAHTLAVLAGVTIGWRWREVEYATANVLQVNGAGLESVIESIDEPAEPSKQ
jgi:hypothetical protein